MPQPLGVDHQLQARVQGHTHLGSRVFFVLAEDEHGLAGRVVELQPGADDPARLVRVQPVVVVAMQLAQRRRLVAGVELDDPDAAVVAADGLDVAGQAGRDRPVSSPDPVLVCLAVVPESAAVHLAGRRRQRGEIRITAALPVQVLQLFPFRGRDLRAGEVAESDVALVGQDVELVMHARSPRCGLHWQPAGAGRLALLFPARRRLTPAARTGNQAVTGFLAAAYLRPGTATVAGSPDAEATPRTSS